MEENSNQDINPPAEPVVTTPISPTNQPPFGSWWKVGGLIVGILLASTLLVGGIYYLNIIKSPEKIVNRAVQENDLVKKSTVDHVHALIRQYYQQYGVYPKNLIELGINEGDLRIYTSSPPFYFKSDGVTYEYYAKLNNGEIFKGDPEGINKSLDAAVRIDVMQITSAVTFYYAETNRLPKNLEEITTLPSLSFFKLRNNPITGRPYSYIPEGDGPGFSVSGTLSNGSEYKEIP